MLSKVHPADSDHVDIGIEQVSTVVVTGAGRWAVSLRLIGKSSLQVYTNFVPKTLTSVKLLRREREQEWSNDLVEQSVPVCFGYTDAYCCCFLLYLHLSSVVVQ